MISCGKPEYVPQLKALWHKVFGDSEEYLDAFFKTFYRPENTLVFTEGSRAVSALYMVPYAALTEEGEKPVSYLYALSTEPSYRGKGIMSKLIERSLEISRERGYSMSVLIPSEISLFDYYRRFGFDKCFDRVTVTKTIGQIRAKAEGHKHLKLKRADSGEIWKAYIKGPFYSPGCIILTEEQNRFYIETLESTGGEGLTFGMKEENDGYVLLQPADDKLIIYESNVTSDVVPSFYASLLGKYSFTSITFHQPLCFSVEEAKLNTKPFAMAVSLDGTTLSKPFINRVLM